MSSTATMLLERLAVGSVAVTARAISAAQADLTFLQWRVLLVAGERAEGLAVGEIADRIGAHPSPASRVVSRLRRRGLLQTLRDGSDARVVRVTLTPSGADLRDRILGLRARDLAGCLATLAPTAADLSVLERLADTFEPFV